MKCACGHPMKEHDRYIGCMFVVEEGRCEPGDDTRDFPDVFCACPTKGEDCYDDED